MGVAHDVVGITPSAVGKLGAGGDSRSATRLNAFPNELDLIDAVANGPVASGSTDDKTVVLAIVSSPGACLWIRGLVASLLGLTLLK